MAVIIFFIEKVKYPEVKNIVEADPYSQDSFARIGYKMREARAIGMDKDGYYLYIAANEDFIAMAKQKLAILAYVLSGDEYNKVKETIEAEDSAAMSGFGDIFG